MYNILYLYKELIFLDFQIQRKGFDEVFRRYIKKYTIEGSKEIFTEENSEEILEWFILLDQVCCWYPRKADCIHKTLIGYKILQSKYGIPVNMVIGIKKFPLEAHAWIQYQGHNLFEEMENLDSLKVIIDSNSYMKGVELR